MSDIIILVDGYNVIHAAADRFSRFPDLESKREHLLRILPSHPLLTGKKIIVFFDGTQEQKKSDVYRQLQIQILFSGVNKEADDLIQEMVRRDSSRSPMQVISSDRRIIHTARDHGVSIITARDFWQKIALPKKSVSQTHSSTLPAERSLSDKEVKEWLKIFRQKKDADK